MGDFCQCEWVHHRSVYRVVSITFLSFCSVLRDLPVAFRYSVEPDILFPPNYKSRVDSVQYLIQSDDGVEDQVFRLQITDAPDLLSIATAPQPESLPLLYENTVLTLPMCGPGANFEGGDQKMIWKATNVRNLINFIDFVGGSTLYQEANMTGVVWVGGMAREIAGGIGVVEIYHR